MIVAAAWPGATVEETLKQVTERLERTLQETHQPRPRPQLHDGRADDDLRRPEAVDAAGRDSGRLVPGPQEHRRHPRHAARRRRRARSSTTISATPSASSTAFTADGFTFRELRDYVEDARSRLLQVQDVSKIEVLGAQDEQVFIEFSTEQLAGLRLDYPTHRRHAAGAEPRAARPASSRPTQERVFLRVTGAFDSEQRHRGGQLRRPATASSGWATSPPCGAASSIRRSRCSASTASRRSASRSRCATPATSWRSAATSARRWPTSRPTCRSASSPSLVADQAVSVDVAINDFMASLWQAILIILVCSFVSLGVRPGRRGRAGDPADAGDRVRRHGRRAHRPAPHLARRADHRADAARRRRDDDGRRDDPPAGRGRHARTRRRRSPTGRSRRRC